MTDKASRTQIVATIGPASCDHDILRQMIRHHLDVVRLNFSWGTLEEHAQYIRDVRMIAEETGRRIPIIQDVPGPRIQDGTEHSVDVEASVITEDDRAFIEFGLKQGVNYIAVSFVRSAADIEEARMLTGDTPIIAKIERAEALDNIDEIIDAADGVMIARGDLGDNIPLERVPFEQVRIIEKSHDRGKPVITATEMLLSMTEKKRPTRAEVTDVAYAVMHGSDGVMLSEETAIGKHPVEAVTVMERIIREAERMRHKERAIKEL